MLAISFLHLSFKVDCLVLMLHLNAFQINSFNTRFFSPSDKRSPTAKQVTEYFCCCLNAVDELRNGPLYPNTTSLMCQD